MRISSVLFFGVVYIVAFSHCDALLALIILSMHCETGCMSLISVRSVCESSSSLVIGST